MKRFAYIWLAISLTVVVATCDAQSIFNQNKTERKYLTRQIIKLQLLLEYTKKGYDIVNKGLYTIGKLKEGDFNLHHLFFSDQYYVKQVIRKHTPSLQCVAEIMLIQQKVKTFREFLYGQTFISSADRMAITGQLDNMLLYLKDDATLIADVLTDNILRMNDTERLSRIEHIYTGIMNKKEWLSRIVNQSHLLSHQKRGVYTSLESLRQLHTVHD
ncbi:hypothetical protein [Chitinophaga cymbidii]|uniref:TerB family tellurite resistance protein n=1 Tax=Chitinophaga cymbidii TaxID=1096750 RepID=A0A512RFR9_9BACT|nr:hypothetical protein [Chitinophaga cymbidii]GEP94498.1 hypothetical protein CCY01nite_07580 [Chitinophaga cymbidii]